MNYYSTSSLIDVHFHKDLTFVLKICFNKYQQDQYFKRSIYAQVDYGVARDMKIL